MVVGKVHITKHFKRYRQFPPSKCVEGTFRTKRVGKKGTMVVLCKKKGSKYAQDVQSILKPRGKFMLTKRHEFV